VHCTDHHDALINANDSRRPESFCGCGLGEAMKQPPTLLKQQQLCALAVSEAAPCNKALMHESNLLQHVSVYHTVCHSARATFTAMVTALQK